MRITASRMRRIIKEEAGRLLAEAENPYYFSDEGQDEDPNFFDDGSDDDQVLSRLATELDAEIYEAEPHPGEESVLANSTTTTFEDGVPSLKKIARSDKKLVDLPDHFTVVFDGNYGWFYFKIDAVWYGIKHGPSQRPPFALL